MEIVAAINEKTFFSLDLIECVYSFVKPLLDLKTDDGVEMSVAA